MQDSSANLPNVIQLGIGMMFVFFAFISQSFVVETVLESKSKDDPRLSKQSGYYSQTVIYGTFLISNLISPPIISFLGLRLSFIFGSLPYALYMMGFLFINPYYLYFSAAVEGLCSGLLWTSVGKYLASNSNERTITRNSNLMWMLYMSCITSGGIFLLVVFGAKTNRDISMSTTRILYGTFSGVCLIGVVVLGLLRQRPQPKTRLKDHKRELYNTAKLLLTFDHALLMLFSAYSGLESSFYSSAYPTALSFTQKFTINTNQMIAFNSISCGIGELTAAAFFAAIGKWSDRVGRYHCVWFGCVLSLLSYALIWINFPAEATHEKTQNVGLLKQPNVALALVCGMLLGFGDGCINVQMYAIIATRYSGNTGPAFGVSKFWHALFSAVCMFYESVFSLPVQLSILAVSVVLSACAYTLMEKRMLWRRKRLPTITVDFC